MNKYLMMLVAAGLIAVAPVVVSSAQAEDHAQEMTLKDGTKVMVEGEMVYVMGDGNVKTAAPDGEHELEDGTKIKTEGGKIVKDEAHEDAAH